MRIVLMKIVAVLGLGLMAAVAGGQPIDETFTYQGKLLEGGGDANGNYNIRVTLEDQAGVLIAGPEEMLSVPVIDGLFSIDLNFGMALYSADRRYLKIEVFEGGVGYVELNPRTPINATPLAAVAMRSLDNEFTRVGDEMVFGDVGDNVILNPMIANGEAIDSTSIFQVNYQGLVGGMYVNGSTSNSSSYYGFARGGASEAMIAFEIDRLEFWIGNNQDLPSLEIGTDMVRSNVGFSTDQDVSVTGSGEMYKDFGVGNNTIQITPVAFGNIGPGGTIIGGTGNFTCVYFGIGGRYHITVEGVTNPSDYMFVATPRDVKGYSSYWQAGSAFGVRHFSSVGSQLSPQFSFIIYKNTP